MIVRQPYRACFYCGRRCSRRTGFRGYGWGACLPCSTDQPRGLDRRPLRPHDVETRPEVLCGVDTPEPPQP